jgi:hypothetical protein
MDGNRVNQELGLVSMSQVTAMGFASKVLLQEKAV